VGHGVQYRDIGAYPQLHVPFGPAGQFDLPGVHNDKVGASPHGFFHAERYDRVRFGGIGPDHQEHVRPGDLLDRVAHRAFANHDRQTGDRWGVSGT
jgi:hypothetical protein